MYFNDDINQDESSYGFFDTIDDDDNNNSNCYNKDYWPNEKSQTLIKTSSTSSTLSTSSMSSSTKSNSHHAPTIICEITDSSPITSCRSFELSNNPYKSIFVCVSMEAFRFIQYNRGLYIVMMCQFTRES